MMLDAGDCWFPLVGDERLKECATEDCGGQPTWRFESGGIGANYCSGCKAKIDEFDTALGMATRAAHSYADAFGDPVALARSAGLMEASAFLERTANASASALRLQYGEMTAQEIRTLRAVLEQQAHAILRMANIEIGDEEGDRDVA